tara:strand:- start:1046 stop:2062 length:1017 start_codon:yes stop_codon:yes gene_type:complete
MKNYNFKDLHLNNKTILVTGGTGSFGQYFVETVIKNFKPKKLIIFSRDENKQFIMEKKFSQSKYSFLRYFIGDIRDLERLKMALNGVEFVIHAAALKHVTIAEYNPFEFIKTNVIGADNLVSACRINNVNKLISISTDKATNPVNLYGASKLAADKIFIAANNYMGNKGTKFSIVKYGNVLGSRGSIIPLFLNIRKEKNKVFPITDPRMTRFFISLEQGISFVLSNLSTMKGGEVFIPKIPSLRIVDLAKAIDPKRKLKIVGRRPGEKIHETLLSKEESVFTVEKKDRYITYPNLDIKKIKRIKYNVDDDFTYESNNNSEWLSIEEIKKFLKKLKLNH